MDFRHTLLAGWVALAPITVGLAQGPSAEPIRVCLDPGAIELSSLDAVPSPEFDALVLAELAVDLAASLGHGSSAFEFLAYRDLSDAIDMDNVPEVAGAKFVLSAERVFTGSGKRVEVRLVLRPVGAADGGRTLEVATGPASGRELSARFARRLAELLETVDETFSADGAISDAFARYPFDSHYQVSRAEILLRQSIDEAEGREERLERAFSDVEGVLQEHPEHIPALIQKSALLDWQFNLELGYERALLNDAVKALDRAESIAGQTNYPLDSNARHHFMRARTYREQERYDLEEQSSRKSVEVGANRSWINFERGYFLRRRWSELDDPTQQAAQRHLVEDALIYLERTTRANPLHFKAHASLGRIWGMKGEIQKSDQAFSRALALHPGHALTLYDQAVVRYWNGDIDGALENLVRLESDPDFENLDVYPFRALIYLMQHKPREAETELLCGLITVDDEIRQSINRSEDEALAKLAQSFGEPADALNCGVFVDDPASAKTYREFLWRQVNDADTLVRTRYTIKDKVTEETAVTMEKEIMLGLIAARLGEEDLALWFAAELHAKYPDERFASVWVGVSRMNQLIGRTEEARRYYNYGAREFSNPWKAIGPSGGRGASSSGASPTESAFTEPAD